MPKDFLTVTTRRTVATSATTRKSLRALIAAALSLALLLTGCTKTDDPEERPATPPVTATPSPTKTTDPTSTPTPEPEPGPEPTATAPDPSQVINENTAEGAKSAVKYFIALYNYTHENRSIELWQPIGAKDCEFCAKVTTGITELLDEDQFIEGGELEIIELGKTTEIEESYWSVDLTFLQRELFLKSADQSLVARDDEYVADGVIFVEIIYGQWQLVDLG